MIWCDLHLGQMTLYQGQHIPSGSCTTFVPGMGLWYFFLSLYRSMDRRQESDAAMLRLSEAKFTLENNIFLINEKYLKQANFLKSLLHN